MPCSYFYPHRMYKEDYRLINIKGEGGRCHLDFKIYTILNRAYKYFIASFYFWVYLFRGIVVYGLIPSSCSLFSVMEDIKEDRDCDGIKKLFFAYYREYKIYRIHSLIFAFITFSIYASLFFLNKVNNKIALIFTIVLIYLLAMILLILTYTINYLVFKKCDFKTAFISSFIFTVKNIFPSLSIVISFIMLFIIGRMNLVFLIFFLPFLYVLLVRTLLSKLTEFEEESQ